MTPTTHAEVTSGLPAVARRIGLEIAAEHAASVDRDARFPVEALDALREVGALGAAVPERFGGPGAGLPAIAGACFELGRSCAATGMVFAMHQIQVLTVARHAAPDGWIADHLRRIAAEQRLVASATSEAGTGGDLGRSVCAVTERLGGISFEKLAPTVSYGAEADDVLVTLRRHPDADPGDQVAVLVTREQVQLEAAGSWDPFGMRGTCSPGFLIRARCGADQVLPGAFADIAAESMTPLSHVLWSHVWLGIATDAFRRARDAARAAAARRTATPDMTALHLSRLGCLLSPLRAEVAGGLAALAAVPDDDRSWLRTAGAALRFNTLKLVTSEQCAEVCRNAMEVAGIAGYRNDTPYSVGRHLRDAMSAALMISNARIHATDAGLLLVAKEA